MIWRTNFLHADTPIRAQIPCLPPIAEEAFFAYADARIDAIRGIAIRRLQCVPSKIAAEYARDIGRAKR
jgi:hypothetical protein